jgi:SUA5 domain.
LQAADIAQTLGVAEADLLRPAESAPRVAGVLPAHYAPRTPLQWCSRDQINARWEIGTSAGRRIGVLAFPPQPLAPHPHGSRCLPILLPMRNSFTLFYANWMRQGLRRFALKSCRHRLRGWRCATG